MVLLSLKAGLRAGEIAKLSWAMVTEPDGTVGRAINLHNAAAKKGSGRVVPLHPLLRAALIALRRVSGDGSAAIMSDAVPRCGRAVSSTGSRFVIGS